MTVGLLPRPQMLIKPKNPGLNRPISYNVETTQTFVNPQLDNVLREVRDPVAGSASSTEVTRPSDPALRQLVAEQLLAAMSGPNAAEQERARKIFIKHGYLDETTNKFRCADSAADRAAAAHTLGIVGSRLATAHLIAGVFDSEPEVCRAAAEALARIGDPAVSIGPLNFLINTQSDQPATDRSKFAEPSYLTAEPEFVETERRVEPERSVEYPTIVMGAETADAPAEIVAGLSSLLPEERAEALARLTHSDAKTKVKLIVNYL